MKLAIEPDRGCMLASLRENLDVGIRPLPFGGVDSDSPEIVDLAGVRSPGGCIKTERGESKNRG